METAVVGLIGVAVGAFAGLAGTWLSLRHENKRWKQNKRDETYQLLGEWISEEWEWARDIGRNGIGPEDATSAPHERHRQVEVMVTIHGSKAIDRLLSKRSRAYVAFHNAATALGRNDAFASAGQVDLVGAQDEARVGLGLVIDEIWDQMRKELN